MFSKIFYNLKAVFVVVLTSLVLITSCSDDDPVTPTNENDFSKIIADYADNVVVATYEELKSNALQLETAVKTLQSQSTQSNLDAAVELWKSTRAPWEMSEAFLFGPVGFLSLDPSLDSWPLDRAQLNEVLNSSFELTPDFIQEGLGFSLRGFHTIEYLLFADGSPRIVSELTTRELEYLVSVTAVLASDASVLYDEWEGAYRDEYVNAGKSGSRYISQEQAVQEIVEGIIVIADEVGNGKISDPYSTKDVLTVESWFSWNSLTDFKNNIISIQNAYLSSSQFSSTGIGLDSFVAEKNTVLDTRIKQEINNAISAIEAIPAPFRNNLNADSQIQAAIDACNVIVNTFENDVKPLISN